MPAHWAQAEVETDMFLNLITCGVICVAMTALRLRGGPRVTVDQAPRRATLPPTSLHAIVWCGDKPVLESRGDDRRERHKREPDLGPMSAGQPKHSTRSEL